MVSEYVTDNHSNQQQQQQQQQEYRRRRQEHPNDTTVTTTTTTAGPGVVAVPEPGTTATDASVGSNATTSSSIYSSVWDTISNYVHVPFTTTSTITVKDDYDNTKTTTILHPINESQSYSSSSSSSSTTTCQEQQNNTQHSRTKRQQRYSNNNSNNNNISNDFDESEGNWSSISNKYNNKHNNNNNNNNSNLIINNDIKLVGLDWFYDQFTLLRLYCGQFVNHPYVQSFIVLLIVINAILMGLRTFTFVQDNPNVDSIFDIIDDVMIYIFTIEIAVQLFFYSWRLFLDGWLVFDFTVIVMAWAITESRVVRAFRIFRALRLVTRIRTMKDLITAIFGVMPRMFAVAGLLFIISYIFSVMFTELFKTLYTDGYTEYDYWGTLSLSAFTLFQIMTLDAWATVCRQMVVAYGWAWIPIVIFVVVASFIITNLIIAIVCDAVSVLRDDEKAKLHGETLVPDKNNNKQDDDPITVIQKQIAGLEKHVNALTQIQNESVYALKQLLAAHPELFTQQQQQQQQEQTAH